MSKGRKAPEVRAGQTPSQHVQRLSRRAVPTGIRGCAQHRLQAHKDVPAARPGRSLSTQDQSDVESAAALAAHTHELRRAREGLAHDTRRMPRVMRMEFFLFGLDFFN